MSWDPFQREVLAELGIEWYVLGGVDEQRAPLVEEPAPSPARAGARPGSSAQGDARAVLLRHLLRAAGGDAREQAVLALAEPLSGLRGNADAKRALWPLLRRLRHS